MFSDARPVRRVTDENGGELDPSDVVVVLSYDEELGPTEATSTLLVNPELRKEYEGLQVELIDARDELVAALKEQSGTKSDVIAICRGCSPGRTTNSLRHWRVFLTRSSRWGTPGSPTFRTTSCSTQGTMPILRTDGVQSELANYVTRLNELLDESAFFSRSNSTSITPTNVTKSLGDNGFFSAKHSLLLHGDGESAKT